MSVDRKRGILFVPTGSAAYDFYGANRKGTNLFANCLLALDAKTGKRIWHFQLVHHDILDRDPPAAPNLITVKHNGKLVDAVAQITKQGYVFVFNRETGEPLFPIKETPVPQSDIPGEQSWPTQPLPEKPAPYARQLVTEKDINPYAENKELIDKLVRQSRSEGPFTPLSEKGTIIYPVLMVVVNGEVLPLILTESFTSTAMKWHGEFLSDLLPPMTKCKHESRSELYMLPTVLHVMAPIVWEILQVVILLFLNIGSRKKRD